MSLRTVRGIGLGLAATALAASVATAQTVATQVQAGGGQLEAAELIEFTVTVEKVDVATREVTVRHEAEGEQEGKVETIRVGEAVQRLDEVKVGDTVRIGVYRSLTLSLDRVEGGEASASATESEVRTEPGELPGGVATRQVTLTAKVTAVDQEASTVSLTGPKGRSAVLEVEPEILAKVAVGDLVSAIYTEALAVSLERVPAAP
jgi:hypothetical protein